MSAVCPPSEEFDIDIKDGKAAVSDVSITHPRVDIDTVGHADVEVEVSVLRMAAVDVLASSAPTATDVSTMTVQVQDVGIGSDKNEVYVGDTRPVPLAPGAALPDLWIDTSEEGDAEYQAQYAAMVASHDLGDLSQFEDAGEP
jgi:hypothetical protein